MAGGSARRRSGPVLPAVSVATEAEVLGGSASWTSSPEHATPTTSRTASTANTRREGIGAHTKHDPARNDNPRLGANRCRGALAGAVASYRLR